MPGSQLQTVILVVLLASVVTVTFILLRLIRAQKAKDAVDLNFQFNQLTQLVHDSQVKNIEILQSQFKGIVDTLHQQLQTSQSNINGHLSRTGETLNQVHAHLAGLAKTAEGMVAIGNDVERLHDLFKAPKLRGNLGETLLENLLKQVLPQGRYVMQHRFKNGAIVDAAVFLGDCIVPIDAKFPLEEFQRASQTRDEEERLSILRRSSAAVRKQAAEIASKYINPAEGTYDFALMYIPSESVYYQIITVEDQEGNPMQDVLERHVIPVSPNTFYAYLMAIAYGLKGLHIEQEAHNIRRQLGAMEATLRTFYESYQTLGRHLANAQTKFNEADRHVVRLTDQMAQASHRSEELSQSDSRPDTQPLLGNDTRG